MPGEGRLCGLVAGSAEGAQVAVAVPQADLTPAGARAAGAALVGYILFSG